MEITRSINTTSFFLSVNETQEQKENTYRRDQPKWTWNVFLIVSKSLLLLSFFQLCNDKRSWSRMYSWLFRMKLEKTKRCLWLDLGQEVQVSICVYDCRIFCLKDKCGCDVVGVKLEQLGCLGYNDLMLIVNLGLYPKF